MNLLPASYRESSEIRTSYSTVADSETLLAETAGPPPGTGPGPGSESAAGSEAAGPSTRNTDARRLTRNSIGSQAFLPQ